MFRLNFATRLMIAMMVIVTSVAIGIIVITQQKVEGTYLKLFETRFMSQIEGFSRLQQVRLESIQERCEELAESPAVIQGLQSGSGQLPSHIREELLDRARVVRESVVSFVETPTRSRGRSSGETENERRERPSRGERSNSTISDKALPISAAPEQEAAASAEQEVASDSRNNDRNRFNREGSRREGRNRFRIGRPDFVDLALINLDGHVFSLKDRPEYDTQVQWLRENHITEIPEEQQMGYLVADTWFGRKMIREVIITPVRSPQTNELLGALVVGVPLSNYGESVVYDLNRRGQPGQLSTGLWIEDQLFSLTIAPKSRDTVATAIREMLLAGEPLSEGARVELDGESYQLLLRSLNTDSPTPEAYQVTLYSLEGLLAEKQDLRTKIIAVSGSALAAAFLVSFFTSRSLVYPIRSLVGATNLIRRGRYDTRLRVHNQDELGVLADSFNEMAAGLEQRERYRNILIQVTDDDVACQLIKTVSLGGERREVSVLFCDIRQFTAITEGMLPESTIEMLNEHMTAFTEIVHRHHGVVDKFVGDMIMAVFGAPKSYGNDAENAARCALEMMQKRRELNQITDHPPLEVGIGIASGPVVAGCMGSENRLNYTVLGARVNLASRLCSAACPGEIIIDPETVTRLDHAFGGRELRPVQLKGFRELIRPYLLKSLSTKQAATDPAHASVR